MTSSGWNKKNNTFHHFLTFNFIYKSFSFFHYFLSATVFVCLLSSYLSDKFCCCWCCCYSVVFLTLSFFTFVINHILLIFFRIFSCLWFLSVSQSFIFHSSFISSSKQIVFTLQFIHPFLSFCARKIFFLYDFSITPSHFYLYFLRFFFKMIIFFFSLPIIFISIISWLDYNLSFLSFFLSFFLFFFSHYFPFFPLYHLSFKLHPFSILFCCRHFYYPPLFHSTVSSISLERLKIFSIVISLWNLNFFSVIAAFVITEIF